MSVKKDASGRRSVQVEVEVPGTPEEVWQAIATGEGVTAWFAPTEMIQGKDGEPDKVVCHMGPGMDSTATVTAWDPPRRFAAESGDLGPNAPVFATEWIVEARSGGTCVVRVVHSLFASTDDWDNQLESTEFGWPGFFRVLRMYLTYFRSERSAMARVMGLHVGTQDEAWEKLMGMLGLSGAQAGERRRTGDGGPAMAGVVEHAEMGKLYLRLDEPGPGIAAIGAMDMCGRVFLMASLYCYGERAAETAAAAEQQWQCWMQERFPMRPKE